MLRFPIYLHCPLHAPSYLSSIISLTRLIIDVRRAARQLFWVLRGKNAQWQVRVCVRVSVCACECECMCVYTVYSSGQ